MKIGFALLVSILLVSFSSNKNYQDEKAAITSWLTKSVDPFLADKVKKEKMFTKRYIEFKNDGFKLLDEEMTEADYQNKWKKIYNLDKTCSDCPYLIFAQDLGKTKTTVAFKQQKGDAYWFKLTIKDATMKSTYHPLVKVIKNGTGYLMDEVWENGE